MAKQRASSSHCLIQCFHSQLTHPCLTTFVHSPKSYTPVNFPKEHADLKKVFRKEKAICLPPHRPWTCKIDFLPNAMPPKCRIYPLSTLQSTAMEEYIDEALAAGYPPRQIFFFVTRERWWITALYKLLGPQLNYCVLPIPLSTGPIGFRTAPEQKTEANIFAKLDLRSAYNLIHITERDEWKTAFHTTKGHYEYLVMLYGLNNAPPIFAGFYQWDLQRRDKLLRHSLPLSKNISTMYARFSHIFSNTKLYVKAGKCEFHKDTITFLGYVITQQGV